MSVSQTLSRSAVVTAALIMLAAQAGQAQTTSTKAKARQQTAATATAADGIEEAAATESIPSATTQSGTTALETNTVAPVNTSTAGLAKAIEAAAPRKVFGEFYTEGKEKLSEHLQANQNSPSFNSYGGVKYDFGNARALSLRQGFQYVSAAEKGFGDFHMQDTMVNYTDGKLATFAKDGSVILIARSYLPTGEQSRFVTHQAGKERLYLFETKSFGKWDLTLIQLGQLFNWTQDSYIGADGKEAASNFLSGTGEFDAFYNFTPVFSLGFIAGADALLNRPLAGTDARTDDFYIEPTIQIAPAKGVVGQIYLYNEIDTRAPSHPFAFLRSDDNALEIWANLAVTL